MIQLSDEITSEGLLALGFEYSDNTWKYKSKLGVLNIDLIKNIKGLPGYDLYINNKLQSGQHFYYFSLKLYVASKGYDFFSYFPQFKESTFCKLNKLKYHKESSEEKLLTWIHNNCNIITEVVSISDTTIWYYEKEL